MSGDLSHIIKQIDKFIGKTYEECLDLGILDKGSSPRVKINPNITPVAKITYYPEPYVEYIPQKKK